MAVNRVTLAASTADVFEVLLTPRTYGYWVVGSKRIRDVDDDWPQPGSSFGHAVGIGPLSVRDRTEVLAIDPPVHLTLEAHAFPLGRARITFELRGVGRGTELTIDEEPLESLGPWIPQPVLDALVWLRNLETTRRLRRLVHARVAPTSTQGDPA